MHAVAREACPGTRPVCWMIYKAVAFRIDGKLPSEAKLLMEDVRLAVNRAIRAGLAAKVSSRGALVKLLYKGFREDHPGMYSQHLVCSFEVAGSVLKNLRRRLNRGGPCQRTLCQAPDDEGGEPGVQARPRERDSRPADQGRMPCEAEAGPQRLPPEISGRSVACPSAR